MTKRLTKTTAGARAIEAEIRKSLPEILSPTVDVIFKILFGDERNKDILADFLTAVLGFKILPSRITLIDPHLPRDRANDKLGILDIKLRLADGKYVNVEMQVEKINDMRGRVEYYISNMLARQLEKSDKYRKLAPAVAIVISKEEMLPETRRFHCEFGTLEKTELFELHGLKAIHILELSKLPENVTGKLEKWLKFINSDKKEEFMAAAQKSRPMRKALGVLERASATQWVRDEYVRKIMAAADKKAREDYVRDEGRAEGKAEGRAEGKAEGRAEGIRQTALNLKANGVDVNVISKSTGLTVDEILTL